MAVRYGIVCDGCQRLHLIPSEGKSSRIRYDRPRGEFTVNCIPPCSKNITFQGRMMLPFVVTEEAIERGYADVGDFRPVAKRAVTSARR